MVSSQPIALPSASNQDSNMNHDFIMGSYSGSVGSNFNPASYTRHFLGSPISWRAGSFGSRFPQGSPSAQLFSSLDQPNTSTTTGELMNAFNVFDREGELCRDYTCCGIHLQDLHALLEHFEEVHVLVLDPNNVETAQLQVPFNPQPGEGLHQSQHSHMQNQHQSSHHHHQHHPSFDAADDMELELDLDNSTHPPQNQSLSPSSHSSPSSGAANSPQHSYDLYQHATPYHSAQASPYTSQPPSPTASGVSTNGLQSHQISNHMAQSGIPVGVHFPHAGPGVPAPTLANPEEAFNSYARFAADYSSHMPGAQPNASNSDEAISIVTGGNGLGDYPGFVQAGRPGIGANLGDNATYNQQQRSPQGIAPALLFASQSDGAGTSTSSASANADPRQGSATANSGAANASGAQKLKLKVRGPMGLTSSASQPATPSTSTAASTLNTPLTSTAASTPAHTPPHTPLPTTTTTSLLLSKPFKCPKPNCNKSYKQANGLKYHMTHGSCNFAPSKDLEHVKDLLEMKRREKEAAGGANLTRSNSLGANPSQPGEPVVHPAYGDLGDITESELREVEREAEKRLRPFACGIGDCQRRYKNMNGLRYHYQHSGDHGALGLAMLAQGTHECLGNHANKEKEKDLNKSKSSYVSGGHHVSDEREGRRRGGAPTLGAGVHRTTSSSMLRGAGGSASVPASRAGSVSRVGTPLPSPIGQTLNTPFSPGYPSLTTNFNAVNGLSNNSPPLTPLTAAVQDMGLRSQPHTPSGSPTRGQRTSPPQQAQQVPQQQQMAAQQQLSMQQQQQLAYQHQFQELQRRQYLAQAQQAQKQQVQFLQQQQQQQQQQQAQQMQSSQMQQQQQYGNYGMTEQAQREYMEAQMRMMQSGQQFDQQQTENANHQQQQYSNDMMMV